MTPLVLNISNATVSSDSSVMEFVCTSNPPRLLHRKAFGIHGNILDVDNLSHSTRDNTSVKITQIPGMTSVQIWERISGGNGIYTLISSAYDSEVRIVAIQALSTRNSDLENDSVNPAREQANTNANLSSTVADETFVRVTTEVIKSHDSQVVSKKQGDGIRSGTINCYLMTGGLGLIFIVITFILIGVIFYMRHKLRSKTEVTVISGQEISSDIVLHDNPAYLTFSETERETPDN